MKSTQFKGGGKIESAYSFLEAQIGRYNELQAKKRKQFRRLANRWMATCTATILTIVTILPPHSLSAPEEQATVEPEPVFESTLKLDNSPTLLVIEETAIEIKPGKSLAQEQAEARARAARSAAVARSVPRPVNISRVSTEEARRLAKEAAAKAGIPDQWKILESIWQVETGKLAQGCIISKADGRATGPMQFMPGTFRAYAADGDGDGHADICNAKDALVAAGNLLKRNGIDQNLDGAIFRYNHSTAYVQKVKRIANSIQ